MISLRLMKAFDVMTTLVAARKDTAAREIGIKLLIGNFNGLPDIDTLAFGKNSKVTPRTKS